MSLLSVQPYISEVSTPLQKLVEHFLLSQQSQQTKRSYSKDIQDFIDFCAFHQFPISDATEITERTLLLWQKSMELANPSKTLAAPDASPTTVARKIAGLSSFLNFCFKRKIISSNPAALLLRPNIKRESKTNALTAAQVAKVLNVLKLKKHAAESDIKRSRSAHLQFAVLHTLLTVGMRVTELCQLLIGDVERTSSFTRLHMVTKGGEVHSPIVHPLTAEVLACYIDTCRKGAGLKDFLFERAQKVKQPVCISQSAVFQMMVQACKEAGVEQKVSPHSCRATVATLLHNGGVAIGHIQELLNHKQVTTTALYIKKANAWDEAAARKMDWTGMFENSES